MARLSEVFVAGGQPTATYVPRIKFKLEERIRIYLETRYKILSISGATKTGKTVLVRSVVPRDESIWLSGGQITNIDSFWDLILVQLDGSTDSEESSTLATEEVNARELDASARVAGVGGAVKTHHSEAEGRQTTLSKRKSFSKSAVALKALEEAMIPLVIDDFHYTPKTIQTLIVRSLKDLVFDGLPVILLSVPHRAFDSVRVEKEMTGRVEQLEVPFWESAELKEIASRGFEKLNLTASVELVDRLVAESFSSPHQMQDFCSGVCRENFIVETQVETTPLAEPRDWDEFFRARASGTSKSAFDRLAIGPRQRRDRKPRTLMSGETVDIYTVILLGIATTGPLVQLRYEELRQAFRKILSDDPPQRHEVTSVLEQMSKIAREEIEGEPVLDWDKEYSTLHISDPFFAFYLRWCTKRD